MARAIFFLCFENNILRLCFGKDRRCLAISGFLAPQCVAFEVALGGRAVRLPMVKTYEAFLPAVSMTQIYGKLVPLWTPYGKTVPPEPH